MAEQIKRLSQETKDLRKELQEARAKLNLKELLISKEKLKTADGDLSSKRELERVSGKLRESEAKNKALEKELAATADLHERIKVLEDKLKASGVTAPAPTPAPKPTPKPAPTPAPKPAPKPAPTPAPKPAPTPAPKPAPEPAPKPDPAPEPFFAAEKQSPTPAPKKESAGPKGSAAKAASPKAAKAPAPVAKKAKAKSKAKAKEASPAPAASTDGDGWSSLSDSTLSRKTVKELTEYLSDKVCTPAGSSSIDINHNLTIFLGG
jgi:outer membrane biosynthesis protein TonB